MRLPSPVLALLTCAAALAACVHSPPGASPAAAPANPDAPSAALPVVQHRPFAQLAPVDSELLRFQLTPEELTARCAALEKENDARLAALVAVPANARVFANTFYAYEEALADYQDGALRLTFLKNIHPDEKVRAASAACEARSGKYLVQVSGRVDLYRALKGYLAGRGQTETLSDADRRLVFLTAREFRRNGMELSETDRAKLLAARSRLAELSSQYEHALDEDKSTFEVSPSELGGLPKAWIARLAKASSGKLVLTTKYPDYFPVMQNARNPSVRHRMEVAFLTRGGVSNEKLLTEALGLRAETAKLLGYATFADFVAENRMAKNAKTVADFLGRIHDEVAPGRDRLNHRMEAMKSKAEHVRLGKLNDWDWRYYLNEIRKQDFNIDDEQVRSYFPTATVFKGLFDTYAQLLHVTFSEVPGASVWATGVTLYEVHDAPSGRLLARFYIDTLPREGKFGHAACFTLGLPREVPKGYLLPMSVLVTNFDPDHLNLSEVEVLFHEFGHVMHASLTTVPYASYSGTSVALDFVEAPSQMLQNWVYAPEVLKVISVDPKAKGQPMPASLARKLAQARTYDAGVRYMRQDYLASLDFLLHTRPVPADVDALELRMREEYSGYHADAKEHLLAAFGHLMNGYEGGYYSYLWSEVFAADMFSRFEKEGVLNPETGRAYRDAVLSQGQLQDADVLLQKFLGRPANEKAFLRLSGIGAEDAAR